MLNLLKKYEKEFSQNFYRGPISGDFYDFENRGSKLILSAPHSVRTFRNKQEKSPDLYTGALVKLLGKQNKLSTIVRQRFSIEKNSITDFIIQHRLEHFYFLDIHGMKENNDYDLAVGTGILPTEEYQIQLEKIGQLSEKYKIRYTVNHPSYTGKYGLTGDLQRINPFPRILQLEWTPEMRNFYTHPRQVMLRTLPFISELSDFIKNQTI